MLSKIQILELVRSRGIGTSVCITTSQYLYWGRVYEFNEKKIVLKPYYTNKEDDLPLHHNEKEITLDEISDID